MAEDIREIVYYKGKPYHVKEELIGQLVRLVDTTKESITLLVEKSKVETEEEFNSRPRPVGYINYTI